MKLTGHWGSISRGWRELDTEVLTGFGVSLGLISLGILLSGQTLTFFSLSGLAIVLGGTFGASLVQHSWKDFRLAWSELQQILFRQTITTVRGRIQYLQRVSQLVKQNGLIVLDREASAADDAFLRLALELSVDGQDPDEIRRLLESEIQAAEERSFRAIELFEALGSYAPAMGLIGTLIGLVQMLGSLGEPELLGSAMAIALLTTLYGAILGHVLFFPIAGKLRNRSTQSRQVKIVTVEGLISLAREENPIVLEQRLQCFTPLQGLG